MTNSRKIKFRAKRLDSGKWVYGDYLNAQAEEVNVHLIAKTFIIGIDSDGTHMQCTAQVYPIDIETLGQFTGLADKYDEEIYEGDIVEFENHGYSREKEKGTVIFKDSCWGIDFLSNIRRKYGGGNLFHRIGQIDEWQDMGASGIITYTYEAIGNIHDNPELLNVEE